MGNVSSPKGDPYRIGQIQQENRNNKRNNKTSFVGQERHRELEQEIEQIEGEIDEIKGELKHFEEAGVTTGGAFDAKTKELTKKRNEVKEKRAELTNLGKVKNGEGVAGRFSWGDDLYFLRF